ncbi:OsmC family protein [Salsipaludibacter albus]|uniref:OsmC family protein n=1 Tax=Salsipaludibacter albus TaxID=2849650 RepID=UPI001EE3ED0F|nr:OsmC family protein [Salsipaludibacter albus]MBY5161011.1 OsmC family protein [Salsipaludibacter albus]
MSTTTREPVARNGVDVPTLFATLDAVEQAPEAAAFQFRATNRWVSGTHSRTTVSQFFGVGEERSHTTTFVHDADHPEILTGGDRGTVPVEYLLVALSSCITAGIGNIASVRGVDLYEVESTVEGDIDLNGILGFGGARNGYQQVRMHVRIAGDASDEVLASIVEQSRQRSAVFDVLTNGVPVALDVTAG